MSSTGKNNDVESAVQKFLGDITKKSATQQIVVGAASGWLCGFVTVKVGKAVAVAVGGSIILLQIANDQGYIKVNWDKLASKTDKLMDKVEERITGEGPTLLDKAERFLDRKVDRAESRIRKSGKKWYSTFIGNEKGACLNDFHLFLGAFVAGVAFGVGSS